jgi:hypothetical protein
MINVLFVILTLCSLKEAQEYAEKNNMYFIETSAKTADNINQLFEVCSDEAIYIFSP